MLALPDKWSSTTIARQSRLDGHISYGQSWRSNASFPFDAFGLNENGPMALMVASIGAFLGPGPMPGSVGISLSSLPIGTTHYRGRLFHPRALRDPGATTLAYRDGAAVIPQELEVLHRVSRLDLEQRQWRRAGAGFGVHRLDLRHHTDGR